MNRHHAKEILYGLNEEQSRGFLTCIMVQQFIDSFNANGIDKPFVVSLSASFVSKLLDHTTRLDKLEDMEVNITFDDGVFDLSATFEDGTVTMSHSLK